MKFSRLNSALYNCSATNNAINFIRIPVKKMNNFIGANLNYSIMGFKETFQINGENLLQKIKEIIAEGNVSKISIADKHGKEIMSFPVTIGAIGLILAPVFAAIGAVAALLTECTITVERNTNKEEKNDEDNSTDPPTTITVK